MIIIESEKYKKSYRKKLKNRVKEQEKIDKIKNLIIGSKNLREVLLSPYKEVYYIEKKKGNLKEYYTARVNSKVRLFMLPVGDYPYEENEIEEIIFDDIDDKHYGEG